jgi:hypothetical protein
MPWSRWVMGSLLTDMWVLVHRAPLHSSSLQVVSPSALLVAPPSQFVDEPPLCCLPVSRGSILQEELLNLTSSF